MKRSDIMLVAKAWASPDDWNVPSLYLNMLDDILCALREGDDALSLARHGKHTSDKCEFLHCDVMIPWTIARETRERNAR